MFDYFLFARKRNREIDLVGIAEIRHIPRKISIESITDLVLRIIAQFQAYLYMRTAVATISGTHPGIRDEMIAKSGIHMKRCVRDVFSPDKWLDIDNFTYIHHNYHSRIGVIMTDPHDIEGIAIPSEDRNSTRPNSNHDQHSYAALSW